jgi:hypothetical protein
VRAGRIGAHLRAEPIQVRAGRIGAHLRAEPIQVRAGRIGAHLRAEPIQVRDKPGLSLGAETGSHKRRRLSVLSGALSDERSLSQRLRAWKWEPEEIGSLS